MDAPAAAVGSAAAGAAEAVDGVAPAVAGAGADVAPAVACAAALASMDLLEEKSCIDNIAFICSRQKEFLADIAVNKRKINIRNPRQCGTIIAFEVVTQEADHYLNNIADKFIPHCLKNGVYLRPLGNTIYIMPPYCITIPELEIIYSVVSDFLETDI